MTASKTHHLVERYTQGYADLPDAVPSQVFAPSGYGYYGQDRKISRYEKRQFQLSRMAAAQRAARKALSDADRKQREERAFRRTGKAIAKAAASAKTAETKPSIKPEQIAEQV